MARGIPHLLTPALLLAIVTLLAACGGPRYAIEYDYDYEASFEGLETWSWINTEKSPTGTPRVDAILRDALESQLEKRGYRFVESGGTFRVGFLLETDRKMTRRYVYNRFNYAYDYYPFDGIGTVDVVVEDYLRGTLILDVATADGKQPMWRGWAEGVLREGMSDDKIRAEASEVIRRVLEKFPPPSKRKKSG